MADQPQRDRHLAPGSERNPALSDRAQRGILNAIIRTFLHSSLPAVLILLAAACGITALIATPREEDPQIVVPLADVYVNMQGHSAQEVEQLAATPLEKLLYQIDGVEYVYSMSREGQAIITVRYYVGEDRERSLVKLFKKIDENLDAVPPGVTGWVVKPVEIDDVPIVTLTLTSQTSDEYVLRRVAEEMVNRLAAVENISRAYVVGGRPRVVYVRLDPDRGQAYNVSPLDIQRALQGANVTRNTGTFTRNDELLSVEIGQSFVDPNELKDLVVGVSGDNPIFLKDVATVVDAPSEVTSYVRHGWGPARDFEDNPALTGQSIGETFETRTLTPQASLPGASSETIVSSPAVTIALAKKKGTNAVWVAEEILQKARELKQDVIPDDIEVVITRNSGHTSNEKVNDLVEALMVAILFVVIVLALGLGLREALIVAIEVPVVFGLTLLVNLLCGFTINRVTLFALILSLGLLVDDPTVDVENITRHFKLRRRASRSIVTQAAVEVRPPLIVATLAVMVAFLPMAFITGMMGPYMRPMALNVPVAMIMSMLVSFTITPWLAYHMLKKRYGTGQPSENVPPEEIDDPQAIKQTLLYRLFYPLMSPLLNSRRVSWGFLLILAVVNVLAAGLALTRHVPLKMLPFDNKNEFQLVLDFDEGTTLERCDAAVREMENYLAGVAEVTDYTSYVGTPSPMDFNGLVRHYYLRQGENKADIRVNLVGKKHRSQQSHAITLRLRDDLAAIATRHHATLSMVETPPGPPVIASVVAEVYGRPDHTYADLLAAATTVRARLETEPGVVDVDDITEAACTKFVFVTDKEKAALAGVSVDEIAQTIQIALGGSRVGIVHAPAERNPLHIELRLPRKIRSSKADLSQIHVKGKQGNLVSLAELGRWEQTRVDQTIYHKNLRRVAYVFAETAGRPPANVVVDIQADQFSNDISLSLPTDRRAAGSGWIANVSPRPVDERTFIDRGSGIGWQVPNGIEIDFAGEGEWKITLDVFRDLGLAFGAAVVGIYIILLGQTRSFVIPIIVMLTLPLTVVGIMPGFWLLNTLIGGQVGAYADPVFFTATAMIAMIALAGIVTRDCIVLVDFIHLSLQRGRTLFEAIMESRVVRLRPILLTSITTMLSAVPITIDPIFSGLAWCLIFGLFASTLFTLFVIPVAYWLLYANKPGHGLPITES